MRKGTLALCLVAAGMLAAQAAAQSGFNGTWRYNADKTRPTQDPVKLDFRDGVYRCASCDPVFAVVADGADHPDSTDPAFDTARARLSSDGALRVARMKAGKVAREITITPSADGQVLTVHHTNYMESSSEPARITTRMRRHGKAPEGLPAINGEWLIERWDPGSENVTTFTMHVTDDRARVHSPTGEGYEAKFDGREYPVDGSNGLGRVRVRLLSPTVLEETSLRAGKVDGVARLELSPDGRSLTITISEPGSRTPTVAIYEKQ